MIGNHEGLAAFLARCPHRGYVASIDTFDGDTEWTGCASLARIFRGATWADICLDMGCELVPYPVESGVAR